MSDSVFFSAAAQDVAIIAAFRGLPFLGYAILARRTHRLTKLVAAAALFAVVWVAGVTRVLPMLELCVAYVYFALAGSAALPMVTYLRAGRVTRPALFVVSVSAFLVIPAIALREVGRPEVLILGWDLVLAWYSYCVEKAKTREPTPLSDCLFFLLVNPVLVYPQRGTELAAPGWSLWGVMRISAGLLTLFASMVLLQIARGTFGTPGKSGLETASGTAIVGFAVLRFLAEYARHSGLASLQIGLMRQLGYVVPERYVWPIFATSPLDFWRRWNTYVGAWALRYVFSPFALGFGKATGAARLRLAQTGGVLVTFAVVGLLHDAYVYSSSFRIAPHSLLVFVASGGLVLLWLAAAEVRTRLPIAFGRVAASATRIAGAIAFWGTTLALFTWWVG
jgi:hypothetical protein